jgi:methyl-accepting chemotaxis protein
MKKLSTIFIITILTCLLISITLTSLVTSTTSKDAIEFESQQLLETLAHKSAEQLNQKISSIEGKLDLLSMVIAHGFIFRDVGEIMEEYSEIVANLNISSDEAFASYMAFDPAQFSTEGEAFPYQVLYVKDAKGEVISISNLATVSDYDSDEEYMSWFSDPIKAKQGVWSDIYYDEFLKTRLITYSTPILINGNPIGVLGIDIKFDDFERIIEEIKVYDTGYAFLMNGAYDYLIHPTLKPEENMREIEGGKYAYMVDIFEADETSIIEYRYNNTDKLMAYAHLSNGWIIAVAPSYKEVYAVYDSLSSKRVYVIGIGFIFSFIVALIVGKKISKPLTLLTEDINMMKNQDLDNSLPKRTHKEFYEVSVLYDSFMDLRQHLIEAFGEINTHNASLEKLVESRTEDLLLSNRELNESLLGLKRMQNEIIEVRKQEEVNYLIKNIAHSINTPLGTAITTHSFIESKFRKGSVCKDVNLSQLDSIEQALVIINHSYDNIRHIVDGLNILTDDFEAKPNLRIPIKTLIESRYLWSKSNNVDIEMYLNLECGDESIICNQSMLLKLFSSLLDLSIHMYSRESATSLQFNIAIQKRKDYLIIYYSDSIIVQE